MSSFLSCRQPVEGWKGVIDDRMRITSSFPKGKEQRCRAEELFFFWNLHVISLIPKPSENNRILSPAASFCCCEA